jgi:outer membrane protein assembly factor BamB
MPIAAVLTATTILSVSFFIFSSSVIPIVPLVSGQSSIQNFATGIAAADGKVFTIDNWGIVNCFNAQTGAKVWSSNAGSYTSYPQSIITNDGVVYAVTGDGRVISLNENTGKVLLQFQAPVDSSIGSKTPPNSFAIGGGYVFVSSNGFAAYNASTGNIVWSLKDPILAVPSSIIPQTGAVWPLGDNIFLAAENNFNNYAVSNFYRINPENGSVLWYAPGYSSSAPLYSQGQVILWNDGSSSQGGQDVVSLDASSGATLWNFSVGSSVYQPIVSSGLLLFASSDSNFYAIHLSDGTLAWKTPVDPNGYIATYNSTPPIVSPIQLKAQNQRVFWGFITVKSGPQGQYGSEQYVGTLCSLNSTSGQLIWTQQISFSGYVSEYLTSSSTASLGLAVGNSTLYLTASSDPSYITSGGELWRIDASTGSTLGTQRYDHYVLPPAETEDSVAVAGDLNLQTYPNASTIHEFPSLLLGEVIAIAVVVVFLVVLMVKKKLKVKGEKIGFI